MEPVGNGNELCGTRIRKVAKKHQFLTLGGGRHAIPDSRRLNQSEEGQPNNEVLRAAIIGELDAINLYDQLAARTTTRISAR